MENLICTSRVCSAAFSDARVVFEFFDTELSGVFRHVRDFQPVNAWVRFHRHGEPDFFQDLNAGGNFMVGCNTFWAFLLSVGARSGILPERGQRGVMEFRAICLASLGPLLDAMVVGGGWLALFWDLFWHELLLVIYFIGLYNMVQSWALRVPRASSRPLALLGA